MLDIPMPKKVYTAFSHVNASCCRLYKSVGGIAHSRNLFAKSNRALLQGTGRRGTLGTRLGVGMLHLGVNVSVT